MIEETLASEGIKYRERLFSPLVTLWAFLSQVIDTNSNRSTNSLLYLPPRAAHSTSHFNHDFIR